MLLCLAAQVSQAGLLFITKQGKGLTCQMFSSAPDTLLTQLQLDGKHYNTHSFINGAATFVIQASILLSQNKLLGYWPSNAYQPYIHQGITWKACSVIKSASGSCCLFTDHRPQTGILTVVVVVWIVSLITKHLSSWKKWIESESL